MGNYQTRGSRKIASTTIAAIATPSGYGGIGVIRISGSESLSISRQLSQIEPEPRHAHFVNFYDEDGSIIDDGLLLYFPGPHSYTGEDVIELHGHGGPVVLNQLLKRVFSCGSEPADPGAFSQRAFINDKLSLDQAEAIMALIHASSEQAASAARNSLQGEFAKEVESLRVTIQHMRIWVESAIDFPEEEIDFLNDQSLLEQMQLNEDALHALQVKSKTGQLLTEGVRVVIAGAPNVGKSSLLNALSEQDNAIVSDVAGTTRDAINTQILIDGLLLNITDTAGLRDSTDPIEQEGIKRTHQVLAKADLALIMRSADQIQSDEKTQFLDCPSIVVFNKIDLLTDERRVPEGVIALSLKTMQGFEELKKAILGKVGFMPTTSTYSVRQRHLDIIAKVSDHLANARKNLQKQRGEILAEELRLASDALGEITGKILADDLLGDIFSKFCIGK